LEKQRSNSVPFVKATACGNDFLVIESRHVSGDKAEFTRAICSRNYGVGADGVEWISETEGADVRASLINSDGSFAEISGNGTRCVAAHHVSQTNKKKVVIATDAGIKTCELVSRNGETFDFRTAMGRPQVSDEERLTVEDKEIRGTYVSVGNPQFIVFCEKFPQEWRELATKIQAETTRFPAGVNVEFVRVVSRDEIEIRIFERGAGETQSSGTGSSASAVASIAAGRVERRVRVVAPGGTQTVEWDDELFLEGPARLIAQGEYFL